MTVAIQTSTDDYQYADYQQELRYFDWWAIQVVVRECKYMRLTRPEMILAIHLMREKGHMPTDIADVLRINHQIVTKILHRDEPPVPRQMVDDLDLVKVGSGLPDSGPFMSRRQARHVMDARDYARRH